MSIESAGSTRAKERVTGLFSGTLFMRDLKSTLVLTIIILAIMCLMCGVLTFAANILNSRTTSEELQDAQEEFFTYLGGLAAYNQLSATAEDQLSSLQESQDAALAQAQAQAEAQGMPAEEAATWTAGVLAAQMTDEQRAQLQELQELAEAPELSVDDFLTGTHQDAYERAFKTINDQLSPGSTLSVEGFSQVIATMQTSDVSLDTYVSEFEYAFALSQDTGAFSGDELSLEGMLTTVFAAMGMSDNFMDSIQNTDSSTLLNTMYFKVVGLLPIFLLVVLFGSMLLASQVDRGSMGYVLSTPTRRRAVAFTQAVFMLVIPALLIVIVCAEKIALTAHFAGSVNAQMFVVMYVGWYLLVEVTAALCYFGGCHFNTSAGALAFGGGFAVWFFLASFLGVFGNSTLVDMGIGVEQLGVFNKLTITGLLNIDAISTVGTGAVDTSFISGFVILAVAAAAFYIAGAVRFCRKDLPL